MNDRPTLNLQVEQKLNLGNFESTTVAIGLSRLPIDAHESEILAALDTAEFAVSLMRERLRGRVAEIRQEGAPKVDHGAFAPAPVQAHPSAPERIPDQDRFDPNHFDWRRYGVAVSRLDLAGYTVCERGEGRWVIEREGAQETFTSPERLFAFADENGISARQLTEMVIDKATEILSEEHGRRELPSDDEVVLDVEVFGIRLPLVVDERWDRPLSGRDHNDGQMLALNAALSNLGHKGPERHRACEAILNAYLRQLPDDVAPKASVDIDSLRELSFAEAHLVLTWLAVAGSPLDAPLPHSTLCRAIAAGHGQQELL